MLQVEKLHIAVRTGNALLPVVENVSFDLPDRTIMGLVGESGCGKSMTAKAILGLLPRSASITGGRVLLDDTELSSLSQKAYRPYRGKQLSMIFQDSMSSLNPLMRIGSQLREVYEIQYPQWPAAERKQAAFESLREVGLQDAEDVLQKYPHQLSGGQRQRVMIAMALAADPKLLVADEPTTALDVSTQDRILSLMRQLQHTKGTSILLISHDMTVISQMCETVGVMYLGWLVEKGPTEQILQDPKHPYTQALLRSIPQRAEPGKPLPTISGSVPSLEDRPQSGCVFMERCPYACEACRGEIPEVCTDDGRMVRCIRCKK